MSFQAYLDAVEHKTGLTPRQLVEIAKNRGYDSDDVKAEEILDRTGMILTRCGWTVRPPSRSDASARTVRVTVRAEAMRCERLFCFGDDDVVFDAHPFAEETAQGGQQ